MMSGHTPGPWKLTGPIVWGPDEKIVGHCGVEGRSNEEMDANARLLFAGPSLVKALESFLEEYCRLVNSGDAGFWDPEKEPKVIAARAALLFAKGERG